MVALALSLAFFLVTYALGRRSLTWGLICLLSIGYFNGILRANILESASYFFFDSALLGLYLGQFNRKHPGNDPPAYRELRDWTLLLIAWPCILLLLPTQGLLIRLVGLRANILFWPMLLLGARLKGEDMLSLASCIAVLNLIALGFAAAEYQFGIEPFFPRSHATELIYASNDVANYSFYRIPAIFGHAHIYGGTMALSICFLIAAWLQPGKRSYQGVLFVLGIAAAFLGILLCAARTPLILAGVAVAATLVFMPRGGAVRWLVLPAMIAAMYWGIQGNERLTRFLLLSDTQATTQRLSQSANGKFYDVIKEYPLGNGLGGGGTSIPYFLSEGIVKPKVFSENEYARIVLEQGWIGLAIFIGFIIWALFRPVFRRDPWYSGRAIVKTFLMITFATAFIGTGLFAAVPYSAMLLLGLGWVLVSSAPPRRRPAPVQAMQPAGEQSPKAAV